jgi:membrane protein involved in colicin uptake
VIFRAIIMSAPMHVVALRCTVIASTSTTLVDVITGISGLVIVDDAVTDRGRFVPSWCRLGMNRGLFLLLGGPHRLLQCKPAVPQG